MSKLAISFLGLLLPVTFAVAAPEKSGSARNNKTDISFEDILVKGKYHFSDEAVVTVEQDKVLDALLGVRKNFDDRIERSSEQF